MCFKRNFCVDFWIFLILHSIWLNPVDEALGMVSAWSGLLCFLVQYGWNSSEACTDEGLLGTESHNLFMITRKASEVQSRRESLPHSLTTFTAVFEF